MTEIPLPDLPVGTVTGFSESLVLDDRYIRIDRVRQTLRKDEYPELWQVFSESEENFGHTEETFNLPYMSRYPVDGLQMVMKVK